jgi:hypothetical protein
MCENSNVLWNARAAEEIAISIFGFGEHLRLG